jgi:hypothetical protein
MENYFFILALFVFPLKSIEPNYSFNFTKVNKFASEFSAESLVKFDFIVCRINETFNFNVNATVEFLEEIGNDFNVRNRFEN